MATINTTRDFIRAMDENPEWLEEVRSRLLTRELLEMPNSLAQFQAEMRAFAAETNRRFELMEARSDRMDGRFDKMDDHFDRMDGRFDSMENNIARMKSSYAERRVLRHADLIADDMGLTWMRNLAYEEIRDMVQRGDSTGMTRGEIQGFRKADIIMESRDEAGETHYIPVEVSFTADARGTNRALRNARFLTHFTSSPAHPVVAGLRKDNDIVELFESGTIYWYQLDDDDFDAH